jgi:hypothetical protein
LPYLRQKFIGKSLDSLGFLRYYANTDPANSATLPSKGRWFYLGNKKRRGRPTNSPKNISIKARLDKVTDEKLTDCVQELKVSKAEIVRRGVHKVHGELPKKKK